TPLLFAPERRRSGRARTAPVHNLAALARSSPVRDEPCERRRVLFPRPSSYLAFKLTVLSVQHGLSPAATRARSAAVGSRSASAQRNQSAAASEIALGPPARIESIVSSNDLSSALR